MMGPFVGVGELVNGKLCGWLLNLALMAKQTNLRQQVKGVSAKIPCIDGLLAVGALVPIRAH